MLSYTNHYTCTHAHSLPSETTRINCHSILTIVTHPFLPAFTHPPITTQMNLVNYLLFPYQIIIIIIHIKKRPHLLLSDPSLNQYIYDWKTPPSTSPLPWCPHQYYTKPAFPTKKSCTLFVPYYPLYTPYTSLLYNIPNFHPLYKTYLILL